MEHKKIKFKFDIRGLHRILAAADEIFFYSNIYLFLDLFNKMLDYNPFSYRDEAGEWVTDHFENSPLMSAYLVAYHVHQLDHRDVSVGRSLET
jgi:hypothetical protein